MCDWRDVKFQELSLSRCKTTTKLNEQQQQTNNLVATNIKNYIKKKKLNTTHQPKTHTQKHRYPVCVKSASSHKKHSTTSTIRLVFKTLNLHISLLAASSKTSIKNASICISERAHFTSMRSRWTVSPRALLSFVRWASRRHNIATHAQSFKHGVMETGSRVRAKEAGESLLHGRWKTQSPVSFC